MIEKSQTRILAYLHISHAGIYAFGHGIEVGESENMKLMNLLPPSKWWNQTAMSSLA